MSYTTKDEQQFINCTLSGPVRVWVKDGKIVRILPLEYSEDDAAPWSIEARGHTFTRPNKAGDRLLDSRVQTIRLFKGQALDTGQAGGF